MQALQLTDKDAYLRRIKFLRNNSNVKKTTGLYGKDGLYSNDDLQELYKKHKNLDDEQLIWDGVVSFDKNFAKENNINHPELLQSTVNAEIKNMLIANNKDPNKFEWWYSMHIDTQNPHIHFGIIEKEPSKVIIDLDKNGKPIKNKFGKTKKHFEWTREGKMTSKSMYFFKSNVNEKIMMSQFDWENFNTSRDNLRDKLNNFDATKQWKSLRQVVTDLKQTTLDVTNKFENVLNHFKNKFSDIKYLTKKNFSYGAKELNDDDREMLDDLAISFINSDPELSEKWNNFNKVNDARVEMMWNIRHPTKDSDMFDITNDDVLRGIENFDENNEIDRLKLEKLKFKNEHIKAKNKKGNWQGIIPNFANKIIASLRKEINSQKFKNNNPKRQKTGGLWNPNLNDGKWGITKRNNVFAFMMNKIIEKEKNKANKKFKEIVYNQEKIESEFNKKIKQKEYERNM